MANFFKSGSVRDFPTSKTSYSSARIHSNMNITGHTNLPVISHASHDAAVSPISKEIDYRLKVLNKLLPYEKIVQLSQEFIGKLESACFEKVAESICADSGVPNGYAGTASICSSTVSHKFNSQARAAAPSGMTSLIAPISNKKNTTQLVFNAAKNLRSLEKDELETIDEEPQPLGLTINSSREKSRAKGKLKMPPKSLTAPSSQDLDDSSCFRKPTGPVRAQKSRANQKNGNSSSVKTNSKKKKTDGEAYMSISNLDLTITKTSLRSNSRAKKYAAPTDMKRTASKKIELCNIVEKPRSHYDDDEEEEFGQDQSNAMYNIMSRPKKTALSPFFNRFKTRCNRITSTPFKQL